MKKLEKIEQHWRTAKSASEVGAYYDHDDHLTTLTNTINSLIDAYNELQAEVERLKGHWHVHYSSVDTYQHRTSEPLLPSKPNPEQKESSEK